MRWAFLTAILAMTACQTSTDTKLPVASVAKVGTWSLREVDGATAPWPVTIEFGEQDRVFGRAPCNLFFATAARKGSAIAFDGIGMTEMACRDPSLMAGDATFVALLAGVDLITEDGVTMILSGSGHVMVFDKR